MTNGSGGCHALRIADGQYPIKGNSKLLITDLLITDYQPFRYALTNPPGRRVLPSAMTPTVPGVDMLWNCNAECPPASLCERCGRGNAAPVWVLAASDLSPITSH
jgi:hypothetical protein